MRFTLLSTIAALCSVPAVCLHAQEKPAAKPALEKAADAPVLLKLDDVLKGENIRPLTIPEKSTSVRDFQLRMRDWVTKTTRAAIDRELAAVPDAGKTVDRLLEWWNSRGEANDSANLLADSRKLAEPSAKLPVTQFFIGELCSTNDADDEALLRWTVCAENLDAAKMPAWPAMLAAARVLYQERPDEPEELRFFSNLHSAIKPDQCSEADSPFIVHILLDELGGLIESRGSQLVVTFGESQLPEWAKLVLLGDIQIHLAWEARGSGWASSVSKEGWKKFGEHLGKAREALVKSWELRPDRPEAAARMITVIMGGPPVKGETEEIWLDRAIAAEFDHTDAYQRMLNALLPRWGGSHAKILALGMAAATAPRGGSDLADILPASLMMVVSERASWDPIYRQPAISRALVSSRKKQIESARNGIWKDHYRGLLAIEAWMSGDYSAATAAFDAMKKTTDNLPDLPAGGVTMAVRHGFDWLRAFDESRVLSSKWGSDYQRTVEALESNRFSEAESLAKKIEPGPEAPELLASLPERVKFETGIAKAEWQAIPVRRALWSQQSGDWKAASDVRVTSDDGQAIRLLRTQLGGRYEVRGKVRLPAGTDEMGFGFALGHPTEFEKGAWFEVFLSSPDGKKTGIHIIKESEEFSDKKEGKPGPNLSDDRVVSFRIRRDNDKLNWWVNDKLIVENHELARRLPDGDCAFGLTALPPDDKEAVVFSELEARQLGEKD